MRFPPELRVHDGCVVLLPPHFAGAGRVKDGERVTLDHAPPVVVGIKRVVLTQGVQSLDQPRPEVLERLGVCQLLLLADTCLCERKQQATLNLLFPV